MSRPAAVLCETCRDPFPVPSAMGPLPKFCKPECRPSRKYTAGAVKARADAGGTAPSSAAKSTRAGPRPQGARPQGAPKGGQDGHVTVTSETEYSDEEREFLLAVDRYKREKKRPFPALSELLQVLRGLGYRKVPG